MSPLLKNIFVGIICLILLGFAYFFFMGDSGTDTGVTLTEDAQGALLVKTQSFIERSQRLQQITIDTSFFNNTTFTSLRSYATDVPNQPLGKENIFDRALDVASVSTETEESTE